MNAFYIAYHNDLTTMVDEYAIDPNFTNVMSAITMGKTQNPFKLSDRYLLHGNCLCIIENLREKVMIKSHASPHVGHRGIAATTQVIETYFYWPSLKKDVHDFVLQCMVCQKVKYDRGKSQGLVLPIPNLEAPCESIAMDFIFGLPKSLHGNNGIWTIVEKFSKQAHFIPVKKTIKPHHMANLFIAQIFKYHGLPKSIIFD